MVYGKRPVLDTCLQTLLSMILTTVYPHLPDTVAFVGHGESHCEKAIVGVPLARSYALSHPVV